MYDLDQTFLDVITPRTWMETPEQRLLFAILERAVRDILGSRPAEVAAAADWLFDASDDPSKTPFSFNWVCEQIGVEPDRFLQTLQRTREQKLNHNVCAIFEIESITTQHFPNQEHYLESAA